MTLSVAVPRIVPAIVGATSEEAAQALEAEGFTAVTYTCLLYTSVKHADGRWRPTDAGWLCGNELYGRLLDLAP